MNRAIPASEAVADYRDFSRPALVLLQGALDLDVVYHRARGDHLYRATADGAEIATLDMVGGFGAGLFGHNHPRLVKRLIQALGDSVPFNAQGSVRGPAGKLCRKLAGHLADSTGRQWIVTLLNTGAESIEAALRHAAMEHHTRLEQRVTTANSRLLKLAKSLGDTPESRRLKTLTRNQWELPFRPPLFLAVKGSFHGKTTGAGALTFSSLNRPELSHLGPTVQFVDPGNPTELRDLLDGQTLSLMDVQFLPQGGTNLVEKRLSKIAGIFVEPIQGEGGVHEQDPGFLADLRSAAQKAGCPLILDEIQSGFGRTGSFLASTHLGVTGDYIVLSKSLGGGLVKIAALAIQKERYLQDFGKCQTSTFAEDDASCLVALEALEMLHEKKGALLGQAKTLGTTLRTKMEDLKKRWPAVVGDVRGRGLLLGFDLESQDRSPSGTLKLLWERGLLGYLLASTLLHQENIRVLPTLSSPNTLRIQPSALLQESDVNRFINALDRVFRLLNEGRVYGLTAHLCRALPGRLDPGRAALNTDQPSLASPGSALPPKEGPETPRGHREQARGDEMRVAADGGELTPRAWVRPPRAERNPNEKKGACQNLALQASHHPTKNRNRVAFLGHFLDPSDMAHFDPCLANCPTPHLETLLDRFHRHLGPFTFETHSIVSATGKTLDLLFLALPLTARQFEKALAQGDSGWLLEQIQEAVIMAHAKGARLLGLGGFTSIATGQGLRLRSSPIPVTTGNAMTVAAGLQALEKAAAQLDLPLGDATLGILGATGNIGSIYGEMMAARVPSLLLIGRPRARRRLEKLAHRISRRFPKTHIEVSDDLRDLGKCDLIVAASSSSEPLIQPGDVSPKTRLICDIALPGDTSDALRLQRPDLRILRGGILQLPGNPDFQVRGLRLPPGHLYACMAETLLLGFEQLENDCAVGPIQAKQVEMMKRLSAKHGFTTVCTTSTPMLSPTE